MNRVKDYLILGLGLLVIVLFLMKCGSSPIGPDPIFIKGKDSIAWDTVPRPYEVIKWRIKTVLIADSMKHEPEDTIPIIPISRYYNDSTEDSNVVIHTHIKTKGTLEELGIDYRLKTPLEIRKTITRVDTLFKPNNINLYGGITICGNNTSLDAKVYLNLTKGRKNVHVAYSPLTKTIEGGLGLKIWGSKK